MVESPKKAQLSQMTTGERLYYAQCSACHGKDRMGNPQSNYPSLLGIEKKYDKAYINRIISTGKGMMPGFTAISASDKQAIVSFLLGEEKKEVSASNQTDNEPYIPFKSDGYNKFLDNRGLPAIAPPWGQLTAIDLNTGEFKWQIPLGFDPMLAKQGIKNTGLKITVSSQQVVCCLSPLPKMVILEHLTKIQVSFCGKLNYQQHLLQHLLLTQ
jgi:quinoprotein glucose dehydrogenase